MTTLARARGKTWAFSCDESSLPDPLRGIVRKSLSGLRRKCTRSVAFLPPAPTPSKDTGVVIRDWLRLTSAERVLARCGLSRVTVASDCRE